VKEYYDARAPEYDEWYLGIGVFAERDRPGWDAAVRDLEGDLAGLPPANTLDVACGTGYLTRHLRGEVTALDQSERMLEVAARRLPYATLVQGDALALPFPDDSFDRVVTAHFYGHLHERERKRFVADALRVAPVLIVVDSAIRPDHDEAEWQTRVLNDNSSFQVYKRYFSARGLADELGGGWTVHQSSWFVAVATARVDADRRTGR
jgi:demethylmenaquinone methyltransferase/2-methoxy-6-polyprenyl-1,4-benzoquinol methylase